MSLSRWSSLIAIAALVGCSDGAHVTISNGSNTTLENLVLSGSRFSKSLGAMEPGAKRELRIRTGESDLRVTFKAAGVAYDSRPVGYFEGNHYRVIAKVEPNFEVSADVTLETY
jgi:hypothetical protein